MRKIREITHLPPLFDLLHPHPRARDLGPPLRVRETPPAKSQKGTQRVLPRPTGCSEIRENRLAARHGLFRWSDRPRGLGPDIDLGKPSGAKGPQPHPLQRRRRGAFAAPPRDFGSHRRPAVGAVIGVGPTRLPGGVGARAGTDMGRCAERHAPVRIADGNTSRKEMRVMRLIKAPIRAPPRARPQHRQGDGLTELPVFGHTITDPGAGWLVPNRS
jgi:hypothetical protein